MISFGFFSVTRFVEIARLGVVSQRRRLQISSFQSLRSFLRCLLLVHIVLESTQGIGSKHIHEIHKLTLFRPGTEIRNSKFERYFLNSCDPSTEANESAIKLIEELTMSASRFISSCLLLVLGKVRIRKDTKSKRSLRSCLLCAGDEGEQCDENEGSSAPNRFILVSRII